MSLHKMNFSTFKWNQTANDSVYPPDAEPLYLEDHDELMIITAVVIGAAAVIGTFGNYMVNG